MSLAQRLSSINSQFLYLALIVVTTIFLFPQIKIPNKPDQAAIDLYVAVSQIPAEKPLLIQSDWTNSSRGESSGQFEALMRILMRRGQKFVLYSVGDPQAPQVARNVIAIINKERVDAGQEPYLPLRDYVDVGFLPNAEGVGQAMKANIRRAFGDKTNRGADGQERSIWSAPWLAQSKSVRDFGMLINITASSTIDVLIERLGGEVPLGLLCTGVIGPQMIPFYNGKQLVGLSIGLKGVYDLEWMMEHGVRGAQTREVAGPDEVISANHPDIKIPKLEGKNLDRGSKYYLSLHAALALMIICVILGNLTLIGARLKGRKA